MADIEIGNLISDEFFYVSRDAMGLLNQSHNRSEVFLGRKLVEERRNRLGTLVHGAHIGVNFGPMLGMVLKNRYHLMNLILHWKLLAKGPFSEKTAF